MRFSIRGQDAEKLLESPKETEGQLTCDVTNRRGDSRLQSSLALSREIANAAARYEYCAVQKIFKELVKINRFCVAYFLFLQFLLKKVDIKN